MAALPLALLAKPIGKPTVNKIPSWLKTVQPPAEIVSQTEFHVVPGLAIEPNRVGLLNKLPKATTIPANENSITGTNIAAPNRCIFCIIIVYL